MRWTSLMPSHIATDQLLQILPISHLRLDTECRRLVSPRLGVSEGALPFRETDVTIGLIRDHNSMNLPAGVAEWQTRWTQNPVSARTCGFKSRLRYFISRCRIRTSDDGFFHIPTPHFVGSEP